MKIQQIKDNTYFVTIPKAIMKSMKWQKGDNLQLVITKHGLILEKEE